VFWLTTPVVWDRAASNKLAPEIEDDAVRVVSSHMVALPLGAVPLTVPTRSSVAARAEFTNLSAEISRDQQRERDMRQLQACLTPTLTLGDPSLWLSLVDPPRAPRQHARASKSIPKAYREATGKRSQQQRPTATPKCAFRSQTLFDLRLATRYCFTTAAAIALLLRC
jgi:hypothetical protein